jgi:hypothetical protein
LYSAENWGVHKGNSGRDLQISRPSGDKQLLANDMAHSAVIKEGGNIPIAASMFVFLLVLTGSGDDSHSLPIYSSSSKMAVRITDYDFGATGGETSVELFWDLGFSEQALYSGGWKSVMPSDVRWKSDKELIISYYAAYASDEYHFTPLEDAGVRVSYLPK